MAFAADALPSCVVRPAQTQGPYFVDEKLLRSDIRPDPSDGSVRPGTPLTLAFVVSRLAGASCTPFEGVLVDVWHCDALGVYSDVVDPGFDTTGKKFLRGYQVTDAAGAASFVTVYPGWYSGRAVHIHFKVRTDPEAAAALEFTSQLYFDDALTDVVYTDQPYADQGERTVRNAGDAIYRTNGSQLVLAVGADGTGGYTATFEIGLVVTPDGECATIADCAAALRAVLPVPANAANAKERRTARRLRRRMNKVARMLERAAGSGGSVQSKKYAKARVRLDTLLAASRHADAAGSLGSALAPIEAAVAALAALLPA
jgi:protocatechuate 3,4-dioxygenase beta subunit